MAKERLLLVLKGQANLSGQLQKADYLIAEAVTAEGVTVHQVHKLLEANNLKAVPLPPKAKSETPAGGKSGGRKAEKDESGA